MYTAKQLDAVETKPGCWKHTKIGIFDDNGFQIGEYLRNYPSYGEVTFFPFKHTNGKWYALYSENYTATSLMELPSCKKIGGETPCGHGFCPVEYYVPRYQNYMIPGMTEEEMKKQGIPECNWSWVGKDRNEKDYDLVHGSKEGWENGWLWGSVEYELELGLVAGCVWGDDCSWKVQRIDLTKSDQGIITREASFGYFELPPNLKLSEAVFINHEEHIALTGVQHFLRNDGKFSAS